MVRPHLAAMAIATAVMLAVGRQAMAVNAFDHIVVVMEENESFTQILGNANAPYLNSLAADGVNFTQMYAVTHPSQPNYLQLFSGSDQGSKNDSTLSSGLTSPNLGAALLSSGRTFAGYSESMPSIGFTGSSFTTVPGPDPAAQNQYVRKHNPWVNWQSATPTGNQLPASVNQPFTSFPTTTAGFAALPTVSFVVPNEQNDMHDGTISEGDAWLSTNISAYANWAAANNSLLVVTFDEDNSASSDRIPTIFFGAHLNAGTVVSTAYTSHNLLATLAGYTGVQAPALGGKTRPIYGALAGENAAQTLTFQQATASYAGTLTNNIKAAAPDTPSTGATSLAISGGTGSAPAEALVKFAGIFGTGPGQVPAGATVLSAKLIFAADTSATNPFSADTFKLFRMNAAWDATSTWNSVGGGIATDGAHAAAIEDFDVLPYATANNLGIFDVTDTVQLWANGGTNNGWALLDASGTDAWNVLGENGATAPRLEITFAPEPCTLGMMAAGFALLLRRRRA